MNTTSQAILETVLSTDTSLSLAERSTVQRLIAGETDSLSARQGEEASRLLVTQKVAANLLSVSRITIWRMTKDGVLHPVEVLPGTWRYRFDEITAVAHQGD
jgi:predicted DNA-binding transcriptional regulator AlpA